MATTTYTITLIDQASAQAEKVKTAFARVAVTASATAQALRTGSKAEQAFARDAEKLARTELRAAKSIMAATRAADRFNNVARKSGGIMGGLKATAAGVAAVFGTQVFRSVLSTGRELLEAAGNAQILERNFARVTGDPTELEQTRALIKGIGLDLEAGEKAALKLRTSFGRFTAESLLKTFSALSLGADEVQRASLALSQIQGRGKLQAEELNQFIEAVPGVDRGAIIDQIAKELKITTAEAGKRLGKGQIAADVGIRGLIFGALESQKLGQGNGERGFGGVDKAITAGVNDTNRQLREFDNTILEVKRQLGKGLAAGPFLAGLKLLGKGLKLVTDLDPKVIAGIATAVGVLTVAITAFGVAAAVAWIAATLPISATVAAIVGITAAVAGLWVALGGWEGVKRIISETWEGIQLIWSDLKAWAGSAATWLFDAGVNLVTGLINGITSQVGAAVDTIKGLGSSVIEGAKDIFGIQSPSKVFAEQGRMIDEGLAMGLDDHQDLAFASAEALADGVVSEAEMAATTGSGINQTAMSNVGAAAGAALAQAPGGAGGSVGSVNVTINVDGSKDTATTMQAIRSFFDTDFAALLERQLEAQGA